MKVHFPSPPLDLFIDRIYYLDGLMPYPRQKIMPASRVDLKINFGGTIKGYEAEQAAPFVACSDSWSMGLWSKYHSVDWPSDVRFFGVSFKPGGAYPFLQLPLSELHNRVVSLDALWGRFAAELRERLYAAPTLQAQFALLDRLLLERLGDAPSGLGAVQFAVDQMARRHGALSIRGLSEQMGISQNHLSTQFKRLVGGTPKAVARLFRFQHVCQSIDPTKPVDWAQVAHESLYYDQSHFNKEFLAFTGHTPGGFLRLRQQVHNEHPHHHAQHPRLLPTD